jgi:hypothetical protein
MAFLKRANALVQKPGVNQAEWDSVRQAALSPAPDFKNRESARVIIQEYDPKRFLLSHCTIIASVDTEEATQPLGRHMVDGFQIDRKYADYHITPETSKYVNNNNDCWERKLLLACFKTFIGAENYVEHIQIPELSKGKIIDAAARNIGDSIYVDILVATDRRHDPLVRAITSGQLGTLSMGCSVDFTTCTKCGNVAEDETHLCPHVRYFKGSEFVDEFGKMRKIAELCGHIKNEPGSVKFIEASWVANPAFTGAVLRNILSAEEIHGVGKRLQVAFSESARVANPNQMSRAARGYNSDLNLLRMAQDQFEGVGDQGGQGGGAAAPETPKKEEDPLHKAVADLADALKERAIEHVRKDIGQGDPVRADLDENAENESMIKSALKYPQWKAIAREVLAMTGGHGAAKIFHGLLLHKKGGWKAVKAARSFSGRDVLALSRVFDRMTKRASIAGESRIYRTVLAVGGTGPYQDVETYLAACRQVLGRNPTGTEAGALLEKGRLYALGSS